MLGGAAVAAHRLHKAFLDGGQQSHLLYLHGQDLPERSTESAFPANEFDMVSSKLISHLLFNKRTQEANTAFNSPEPGVEIHEHPQVLEADIVNVHWVTGFMNLQAIAKLVQLKKPIVFTLHDEWLYTGGCHYTNGCDGFLQGCPGCPQLDVDLEFWPRAVMQEKLDMWHFDKNFSIVTPSRWLLDRALRSPLMKKLEGRNIENSLDAEFFVKMDKTECRKKLEIEEGKVVLLFGCSDHSEKRKGAHLLREAIEQLSKKWSQKLLLVTYGRDAEVFKGLDVDQKHLGVIDNIEDMVMVYNASDVMALPSLEDNLPNAMLEAFACGVPVLGFDVGGVSEVVQDNINGRLLPPKGTQEMGEAILDCLKDPSLLQKWSQGLREDAKSRFSIQKQSSSYLDFFEKLLREYPDMRTVKVKQVGRASEFFIKSMGKLHAIAADILVQRLERVETENVKKEKLIEVMDEQLRTITKHAVERLKIVEDQQQYIRHLTVTLENAGVGIKQWKPHALSRLKSLLLRRNKS